jgi:hypothetical protein
VLKKICVIEFTTAELEDTEELKTTAECGTAESADQQIPDAAGVS